MLFPAMSTEHVYSVINYRHVHSCCGLLLKARQDSRHTSDVHSISKSCSKSRFNGLHKHPNCCQGIVSYRAGPSGTRQLCRVQGRPTGALPSLRIEGRHDSPPSNVNGDKVRQFPGAPDGGALGGQVDIVSSGRHWFIRKGKKKKNRALFNSFRYPLTLPLPISGCLSGARGLISGRRGGRWERDSLCTVLRAVIRVSILQ